jgi:hypothetical protein
MNQAKKTKALLVELLDAGLGNPLACQKPTQIESERRQRTTRRTREAYRKQVENTFRHFLQTLSSTHTSCSPNRNRIVALLERFRGVGFGVSTNPDQWANRWHQALWG